MTCSVHPCQPVLPVIDKKNTTCCPLDYTVQLISSSCFPTFTNHNQWKSSLNVLAAFKQCYKGQAIRVIIINKLKKT